MESFLERISTFEWWLSVVLVGVLINLASAYIKPLFDKYLASRSQLKRRKLEKEAQRRDLQIKILSESSEERQTYRLEIIDTKQDATFNILMGIFLLLMVIQYREEWSLWLIVFLNVGSLFSIFISFHLFISASQQRILLIRATEVLTKNRN